MDELVGCYHPPRDMTAVYGGVMVACQMISNLCATQRCLYHRWKSEGTVCGSSHMVYPEGVCMAGSSMGYVEQGNNDIIPYTGFS
jgi:hypothetical protein